MALLAVLFLFANSCHDEVANDEGLTLKSGKLKRDVTAEMKSLFERDHQVNKFVLLDYIDQIKWESSQVMEIDNSTVVEVQVKLKGKYKVMSEKDPLLNLDYRLLFIEKNGTIASYMEYLLSKKDLSYLQDTQKASYLKKDGSFEGTIVLEDSKNEFSTIYHSTGNSQELRLKDLPVVCVGLYELYDDGSSELIEILYCTSSGGSSGGGGGGGGGGGAPEPSGNVDCNFANSIGIDCNTLLAFENDYKTRMSSSETQIFENMTRVQQLSYLANAQFATWKSEDLFPNSLYNGKGDAFRHALWNALNAIDLGYSLAESLTTAHEQKPASYPY